MTRVDLEVVIRPLVTFLAHADSLTTWLMEEWPDSRLSFEARRERLVAPQDCPPTQVAVRGNEPIGVVAFRRFRREGDEAPSLFIDALYTCPPFRNRGVASLLLEVAVNEAGRCARELFVYTDRPNWYEKRGWSLVDADPRAPFVVLRRSI